MPSAACPECQESVFVDADSEQGEIVTCDECGTSLEVVGLDPVELDISDSAADEDYDRDDFSDYDDDLY